MEKRLRILGLLSLIETMGLEEVGEIYDLSEIPADHASTANSIYEMGLFEQNFGDFTFCPINTKAYEDFKKSLLPETRTLGPQYQRVIADVIYQEALSGSRVLREGQYQTRAKDLFGDHSIKV